MNALAVAADPSAAPLAASVLASLPVSFAPASADAADVQVIDGTPGWHARALELAEDGTSVLVIGPGPVPAGNPVPSAAAAAGRIHLDLPFAGNPAIAPTAPHLRTAAQGGDLLEVQATIGPEEDPAAALLDLGLTIRALLGPLTEARLLHAGDGGAHVLGTAAGIEVSIALETSRHAGHQARLRVIGAAATCELELPDPATARPAHAILTTAEGRRTLPTLWESSHRAAWRRLHERADVTDLADLRETQSVLETVLESLPR